jgi:hypothetical protein
MKRERRKPTRAEWKAITSKRPVVRRIARQEDSRRVVNLIAERRADKTREEGERT